MPSEHRNYYDYLYSKGWRYLAQRSKYGRITVSVVCEDYKKCLEEQLEDNLKRFDTNALIKEINPKYERGYKIIWEWEA